jgi:F-type H+-transporting ATPase subunit delta
MNYPRVASRYSKALLDLAIQSNSLDQVCADATALRGTIASSRELELLLKSPIVKADKKQAILKEIFAGKCSSLFEEFVMLLTKNGRESHLSAICDKFEKDVLAHKGIVEAHVVTAVAMSDADKKKLSDKLKSQLGKEVLLTERVDASVVGGLKLHVDGYEIDNTIAGKLRALRNALLS